MMKWLKIIGGVIGFLIAVVGVAVGLWPLLYPSDQKQISYETSRFLLFDQSKADNQLFVLDAQRQPIEGNLYAVTISVWNSGPQPIPENNGIPSDAVIKPYTLTLTGDAKFKSFRLAEVVDNEANVFKLVPTDGRYQINWRRFLPGTGFRVVAIVETNGDFSVQLDGRMVGVETGTVEESPPPSTMVRTVAHYILQAPLYLGAIAMGGLFLIFGAVLLYSLVRWTPVLIFSCP